MDQENTAKQDEFDEEDDSGAVSTGLPAKKLFLDPEEEFRKRLEDDDKDEDISESESRKEYHEDDGKLYQQLVVIKLTYNVIPQRRGNPLIQRKWPR